MNGSVVDVADAVATGVVLVVVLVALGVALEVVATGAGAVGVDVVLLDPCLEWPEPPSGSTYC